MDALDPIDNDMRYDPNTSLEEINIQQKKAVITPGSGGCGS